MIVSRSSRRRGDAVHRRFRSQPGSGYVASGFALGAVDHLVRHRHPRVVLEVGAGIGAITAGVAEAADGAGLSLTHLAIEDVPFCLDQLAANLGDRLDRIQVAAHVRDLAADGRRFDLVIVDGGATDDRLPEDRHRWTADDEHAEVQAWIDRLAPGAVVLVENRRDRQRGFIEAEARRPFVHEHVRPFDAGPGYHLYWFDPGPIRRATVAVAQLARRTWFPHGARLERRAYRRLHGHPRPERETVAPGED